MSSIISIITQLLSYSDQIGTTDNPNLRNFDWSRHINGLQVDNPSSDKVTILPNQSKVLFDGIRTNPIDATSILSLEYVETCIYRLSVTSGSSGFRTARTLTSVTDCVVTVNNNSVAKFVFTGASFPDTVAGDIMRIAGDKTFDIAPYSFNPLNSGLWTIISVSGNTIQAIRKVGEPFEGAAENVTGIATGQVQIYSADGIQNGDKFEIKGAFSSASQRTYEVLCVTPDAILFSSVVSLPEESGIAYPDPIANGHSIVFYSNAKRIFYLEIDQDVIVRLNGETGDYNKVSPISVGSSSLVGYFHKFGLTYKAEIVNKSVNPVNVLYFVAE